jgi:hypothetical protein
MCRNYDPIMTGAGKESRRGWCAALSVYPFKEQPGQIFPAGVKRAVQGQLASSVSQEVKNLGPTAVS